MRVRISLAVLLLVSMLAGCAAPAPTPTPTPRPTATPILTDTPVPTATPTSAATATPTATATTTPTGTPTPEPTPDVEDIWMGKFEMRPDGFYNYISEKGTTIAVDQVPFTHQELDKSGWLIYKVEPNNPYGLDPSKEGQRVAAVYYPEAHVVTDKIETAQQIGAVGIRPEVERYLLEQASSPGESILFALPFDITTAQKTPDNKLLIQFSKNTANNQGRIFLRVPVGSVLTNPIEKNGKGIEIESSRQEWGTAVNIGWPGFFITADYPENSFTLLVRIAGDHVLDKRSYLLGEGVLTVGSISFKASLISFYQQWRDPPPLSGANVPNVEINGQSYFEVGGESPSIGFRSENIVHFGESVAFILNRENPLLAR